MKCSALQPGPRQGLAIRLAVPCLSALMAFATTAFTMSALAASNQFLKINTLEGESTWASSPRIVDGDRVALTEAGFKAFLQKNGASASEVQFFSIELLNASVAAIRASKNGRIRACARDLCISGKRVE